MIPACPIAAARDALTLLQTGRASMAVRILETLPEAIEAALKGAASEAYLRGQADAHRMMAAASDRGSKVPRRAPLPSPAKTDRIAMLRTALADPARRQLVKAALGMGDRLIERVAAGGATLSGTQWRRLREVLR